MALHVLYDINTKKVLSIWEYTPDVVLHPPGGQQIGNVLNFNLLEDIPNAYYEYVVEIIQGSPSGSPTESIVDCNIVLSELTATEEFKEEVKEEIDTKAGETRKRFVTNAHGQFSIYQDKVDEATEYVAAGYPTMGDPPEYPFIAADSEAFGITHQEAADNIITRRAEWIQICVNIEKLRLSAKHAIDLATSEKDINTERNSVFIALEEL